MNEIEEPVSNPDCEVFKKIYAECLDVAYIICHHSFSNCEPQKFEDVLNSILPSAVVLKSAYWPFYRDSKNRCLCICKQYGIVCQHITTPTSIHCLDLIQDLKYRNESYYISSHTIKPLRYSVCCMPTPKTLPEGYLVSAKIFLGGYKFPEIRKMRRQRPYNFFINNRYVFVKQRQTISTQYHFLPAPKLKQCAENALNLKTGNKFPDKLLKGYKLEGDEFPTWTTCMSLTELSTNNDMPRNNEGGDEVKEAHARYFKMLPSRDEKKNAFKQLARPYEVFLRAFKEYQEAKHHK